MLTQHDYPILEFDDAPTAKLNPSDFCPGPENRFSTDKLVITFFPEVVKTLAAEGKILPERTIPGENPVEIWRFCDADILLTLGQVGCPACGGNLDLFCAMASPRYCFVAAVACWTKTSPSASCCWWTGPSATRGFPTTTCRPPGWCGPTQPSRRPSHST